MISKDFIGGTLNHIFSPPSPLSFTMCGNPAVTQMKALGISQENAYERKRDKSVNQKIYKDERCF